MNRQEVSDTEKKVIYEAPEMQISVFDCDDIITESPGGGGQIDD